MRAIQVLRPEGQLPASQRVALREVPEPEPGPHDLVIRVHSVGVSFPDLLLSKGLYQLRPEPPFTPGVDIAGEVVSGPEPFHAGQRVAAVVPYGGAAELAVVPVEAAFALPDQISFDEGAALPMNYLTAQFALATRAGLRPHETVLIHGAAGGVGTAMIQVAKGYGARTIAVASTADKAEFARAAGADEAILAADFRQAALELTGGVGVDVVVDVVGGDLFTDSLRALAPLGRLLVVGFAAGQGIPEVKVNRLLLNNIDVRGVGWGAFAMARPGFMQEQWRDLLPLIGTGVVKPPVGATYSLAAFAQALDDLDQRRALGKLVVRAR